MATLLLILAIGWLLFSLLDWLLSDFDFWQLTTIVPTPVFFIVDLSFVVTGFLVGDTVIIILGLTSFILQLRYADWQPIIIWRKLLSVFSRKKTAPNAQQKSLDGADLAAKSELASLRSQLEKFSHQKKTALKVFNWNTLYWHNNEQELSGFLHERNADIYHLQEAWLTTLAPYNVEEFVKTYFPNYFFAQHFDIVTISKYPIVNVVKGKNCLHFGCWLRADIEFKGQIISAYNIHMPVPFEIAYTFKPGLFLKYYKIFQSGRREMSEEIEKDFLENKLPFVVTGDFNTIKRQPPVRKWLLNKNLKEASGNFFTRNGDTVPLMNLFPITLKAFKKLPLWRVDWVFTSKFAVKNYRRLEYNQISDHYPMIVELEVEK